MQAYNVVLTVYNNENSTFIYNNLFTKVVFKVCVTGKRFIAGCNFCSIVIWLMDALIDWTFYVHCIPFVS